MLGTCSYTISDSILIAEYEYAIDFIIACIFQKVLAFKVEKWRISECISIFIFKRKYEGFPCSIDSIKRKMSPVVLARASNASIRKSVARCVPEISRVKVVGPRLQCTVFYARFLGL